MTRTEPQHAENRSDDLTPTAFRQPAEDHHPRNGHERQQQVLEPQQQEDVAGRPAQHENTEQLDGDDANRQFDLGDHIAPHGHPLPLFHGHPIDGFAIPTH